MITTNGNNIPVSSMSSPTIRDKVINAARGAADLVHKAEVADPDLAKQLVGKSLWTAKSPPATILAFVIAWLATKYGLDLDDADVGIITLLVGTVVAYIMRWITHVPIATLISKPEGPIQPPDKA